MQNYKLTKINLKHPLERVLRFYSKNTYRKFTLDVPRVKVTNHDFSHRVTIRSFQKLEHTADIIQNT